ncbi:MAG: acyl-CoA dehydrogenase [Planctomycetes bacterium]|nr:acyl-CoA dehydrogenase [Planctomycetota bacterium]
MDFDLTEDHLRLREMVRDFARSEIAPNAAAWDRDGTFPAGAVRRMGELGLMGVQIPEAYGGAGLDPISGAIVVEEIARADASSSVILSVNNSLVCNLILKHGSEEQKRRILPDLASGRKLGCYGLSEPGAGSDSANQKTRAVRDGSDYVLTGTKNFITTGSEADVAIVIATTDPALGKKGISAFVVPTDTPGFRPGKPEKKMGLHASPTTEIHLENCRVPAPDRIGEEGAGLKIALSTLDEGRIGIGAQAVGIAQASLDAAISYSKERTQFGSPIASFQSVQWMLADMATEIEAARLLVYRAAHAKTRGGRYTREAAMAKLFASETCRRATEKAVQIHGGYGYTRDYPVERYFRDGRITEIYEGTSQMQRLVIARGLLGE